MAIKLSRSYILLSLRAAYCPYNQPTNQPDQQPPHVNIVSQYNAEIIVHTYTHLVTARENLKQSYIIDNFSAYTIYFYCVFCCSLAYVHFFYHSTSIISIYTLYTNIYIYYIGHTLYFTTYTDIFNIFFLFSFLLDPSVNRLK